MGLLEFILVLAVIFTFLTGWCLAMWHCIDWLRRKHRLERDEDDRRLKKQHAEDWAILKRELADGSLTLDEYLTAGQTSPELVDKSNMQPSRRPGPR